MPPMLFGVINDMDDERNSRTGLKNYKAFASQNVICGPAASTSSGNLLKIQNSRYHARSTES